MSKLTFMPNIREWVSGQSPINKEMIVWAENTAKDLADLNNRGKDALTASTIRRFFGEMRRIQSSFSLEDAQMLQAKLAYDAGRKRGKVNTFYRELTPGIQAISDKDSFNRFVKVVEAIVSFHKLHYIGKED